ncbi:unnamed protein product [Rangifer tarandus platyrhynchus]|uniref:Uncharacterized protein n=1 Tax=Rangifer tarandus platyrhynchus TaxID=3082113 RepID=A0AC59YHV9_RANTA
MNDGSGIIQMGQSWRVLRVEEGSPGMVGGGSAPYTTSTSVGGPTQTTPSRRLQLSHLKSCCGSRRQEDVWAPVAMSVLGTCECMLLLPDVRMLQTHHEERRKEQK